jgi:hypothetical protein
VARLIRPQAVWDVNHSEGRLLTAAILDWERSASEHARRTGSDAPVVRIRDIRGGRLTIEAQVSDHELTVWSERFPMWHRLLASTETRALVLDGAEAEEFWRDELAQLVDLGVRIELPSKWSNPSLTVRGRVNTATRPKSQLALDQIVQVDWQVLLGDQPMSIKDLETLVRAAVPLVRVNNQFVVVDEQTLARAKQALERSKKNRVKMADALRWAVGGPDEGVELITAGQLYDLLAQLTGPQEPFVPLNTFRGDLRAYQQDGVDWLVRRMRAGVGAL